MPDNRRHFGFRIEPDTLEKLHYISDYEGRSINGHVLYLIREDIRRFEKEHGKIDLSEQNNGGTP